MFITMAKWSRKFPGMASWNLLRLAGQEYFAMKNSQQFLNNAENCAELAERAKDEPSYKRFKLMEAGWLALAREQDWLDGVTPPTKIASEPCQHSHRRPSR